MAYRIGEQVMRGELDNTERGRVRGTIWLAGRAEPLTLDLEGDCAPDLAGCTLQFENPNPKPDPTAIEGLWSMQSGWAGEITASRKIRVLTVPIAEFRQRPDQWRLENLLSLEWHSRRNFRVVIQTPGFRLTISEPRWRLTPAEHERGLEAGSAAFTRWLAKLTGTEGQEAGEFGDGLEGGELDAGEEWKRDEDGELPPADSESAWTEEDFEAFDKAPLVTPRSVLHRAGFEPMREPDLNDAQLPGRLWELIYALAACRIYFDRTDHLSDRALYAALDRWLDVPDHPDLPPGSRVDAHVDIGGASTGSEEGEQIFLRYYASEEDRADWLEMGFVKELPPAEKPGFRRDVFLPGPPLGWDYEEHPLAPGDDEVADNSDPLGLGAVDRQIAARSRDNENAPAASDTLLVPGLELPPQEELPEKLVGPRLWELLHQLALRGMFVAGTNHLTDRDLYARLWRRGALEATPFVQRSAEDSLMDDCSGPEPAPVQVLRDWRLPQGPAA